MNKETLERIKRVCTNIEKLSEEQKQYLYENKTEKHILNLDYWLWDFEELIKNYNVWDCCIIKFLDNDDVVIDYIRDIKVIDDTLIKIETVNNVKVDYNILDTINLVEESRIYFMENDKLQITLIQKCKYCRFYKYKFECKK